MQVTPANNTPNDASTGGAPGDSSGLGMSLALTWLFAVAGGVAAGSLFYAQPLLELIAHDLRVTDSVAGLLVTVTQIGYSLGILLIVPLGDYQDRRKLIPFMFLLSTAALILCSVAPNFATLGVGLAALGVTSVSGQLLTPLASQLAEPARRGRIVGIVVSGLITGTLVARAVSGAAAAIGGWRTIFEVGAATTLLLAIMLRRAIPPVAPIADRLRYNALLASIFRLVATNRTLRSSMLLGATGYGMFSMFWTALTFHLSDAPFGYSAWQIGLVGVAASSARSLPRVPGACMTPA